MTLERIEVSLVKGGYSRDAAIGAVKGSGLPDFLRQAAGGPFGQTALGAELLEGLVEAVDLGVAAASSLAGVIAAELKKPESFEVVELGPEHHRLVTAWQIAITADAAVRRITQRCPVPEVEGSLELDGIDELLDESKPPLVATRVLRLARAYLEAKMPRFDPDEGAADAYAGTTIAAGLLLLRKAVEIFARTGTMRPMLDALGARSVRVAGYPYQGLKQLPATETPAGLLPIWPEEIVGNTDYVEAGLRLARDVAGYDMTLGKNPKQVNPILFGLGTPGSGKTVTGHAIGNYFLKYCRERNVPARFLVVRRSDWASSYQNASAANLIRIFREEVYGFDGVCGVYWPDIDTALASRANTGLRMEEKQNLGAVFGVFDGTLLPRDGKWFMVCDANTMHMDEAAISRIAQNPFTVNGPETPEHFVTMMRDLMLRDVKDWVPHDDAAWLAIGTEACAQKLSGRNVDAICNNIRAEIQDFEFPESYFQASAADREKMIGELSHAVDQAFIMKAIADWVAFKKEAARRDEEERFQAEVDAVVRQLNAGRAAMEKAGERT